MRVNRFDLVSDARECHVRGASDPCVHDDQPRRRDLLKSHIKTRLDVLSNSTAVVFRVTRDADDGYRLIEPVLIVNPELPANGILSTEEVLHHRFIYDGHAPGSARVLCLNAAAGKNRNAYYAEVIWADIVFHGDAPLGRCRGEARHDNRVGAF